MINASAHKQELPLQGVRVVELSHIIAGPSGGMMLGDLGADVIKIEHPAIGDTARSHDNAGGTFYTFNRNKKFLALDLRQPKGKAIFEKLVARCGVVLDNFAPGALARLGLDYITTAQMTGVNPAPRGTHNSGMGKAMGWGVYQLFPTRDGKQVFIAVTGNRHWAGLCDALGFDDWKCAPEFSNNRKRSAEKRRIAERVKEAVQTYTYDEITARLYKALVPYAPVGTPLQLVDEKHLNEAQRWLPLKIGDKDFKVPKLPLTMGRTREFEVREQPACLGEHTDSILEELGYTRAEIEALKSDNVVLRSNKMHLARHARAGEGVVRLNREIVAILAMPDIQKLLLAEGGELSPSTPEEFAAFIRSEVLKWAKVIRQAGITAE